VGAGSAGARALAGRTRSDLQLLLGCCAAAARSGRSFSGGFVAGSCRPGVGRPWPGALGRAHTLAPASLAAVELQLRASASARWGPRWPAKSAPGRAKDPRLKAAGCVNFRRNRTVAWASSRMLALDCLRRCSAT